MITKLIAIALVCLPLAACDFGSMDALEIATTGHDMAGNAPKAALLAQNQPVEAISSSISSQEPIVVVTPSSSSSEYVAPLTEACLPGEKVFRLWDCGPDGHRVYW